MRTRKEVHIHTQMRAHTHVGAQVDTNTQTAMFCWLSQLFLKALHLVASLDGLKTLQFNEER